MKHPCRGMSLLELLIAAIILSLVVVTIYSVLESSAQSFATGVRLETIQDNARRVVDQIAEELRMADATTLITSVHNNADRIQFRNVSSYTGGAIVWSSTIEYRYEPSTIDANENGKADDGKIVRVQNGQTQTMCDYLKQGGIKFTRSGNNMYIKLTLINADGRYKQTETFVETSITLRNSS